MLSAIGRASVRRVVAGASRSTTHRPFQSLLRLARVNNCPDVATVPGTLGSGLVTQRSYATATATAPKVTKAKVGAKAKAKPKKAVKKAVKKVAKKPAKKVVKKKVAKKSKKKVLKKPAKRAPISAEVKEKLKIKSLKEIALRAPKGKASTAWTVLMTETLRGESPMGRSGISTLSTGTSAKYKNMTIAELEPYKRVADQNKASNDIAYKQWVESHTPDEIHAANLARLALKRKNVKGNWEKIQDPRLPKRPVSAYLNYIMQRRAAGAHGQDKSTVQVKALSQEWNALSPSEKQPYEALAAADTQRYAAEVQTVFKRDLTGSKKAKAA